MNVEEYELRNQQKQISQHLVDLSSCLNNLIQRGATINQQEMALRTESNMRKNNQLPSMKIKKKPPGGQLVRQKSLHTSLGEAKQLNLVPRVAYAVPKHRQPNAEPVYQPAGLGQSASAPALPGEIDPPNKKWINYLN